MASSSNRPDFRNSTAKSKNKSRSLSKFIRRHLSYNDCTDERITGPVPSRIKDLIKLVKYWYKEYVRPGQEHHGHEPVLNNIEKATVEAWRKYGSPKTINMAIAFVAVMEELQNYYPCNGESSTSYFRQTVVETLLKPMFVDVSVTTNWCRTPTVQRVKKATLNPSGVNKDFRDIPASEQSTINTFITDKLQPDVSFSKPIHNALDKLCRILEGNPELNVARIKKSGSMGKGTALKGKSDLDCVMVLNDIKDAEDLKGNIKPLEKKLIRILQATTMDGWKITVHGTTPFCVKFSLTSTDTENTTVSVDLLPTFDINKIGKEQLYCQMNTKDELTKRYYSAAVTELQLEFVRPMPARVKDLIRLVKYWCKEFVVPVGKDREVYPNSYLLELVTIHAWEEGGNPNTFDIAVGFRAVMETLWLHKNLNKVWYNNYGSSQVLDIRAPRVVDPANPFNNVYDIVTAWPRVMTVVNETLRKPFAKEVIVTNEWK